AAQRVGIVLALRDGDVTRLKPLTRVAEPRPALDGARLALARWIAAQSLSSLGSTCAALLPPPSLRDAGGALSRPPDEAPVETAPPVELLIGAGRERRLVERIAQSDGAALVIVADIESAARWAQRLARIGRVARLDSGVEDAERTAAWQALERGETRLAVGTRSALLAALARPLTLALVDEDEAADKPPGP